MNKHIKLKKQTSILNKKSRYSYWRNRILQRILFFNQEFPKRFRWVNHRKIIDTMFRLYPKLL